MRHEDDDGYFDPANAAGVGAVEVLSDYLEFATAEEWEAYRQERDAALRRKRPIGFSPWPSKDA